MPRRRQLVVRMSDAELEVLRARAAMTGLAVGAWVGQMAVLAAGDEIAVSVGLPDLLRLHADVVSVERAAAVAGVATGGRVAEMLDRLDAVIDVVVAEMGRVRR